MRGRTTSLGIQLAIKFGYTYTCRIQIKYE
jgi:hypothetical protein